MYKKEDSDLVCLINLGQSEQTDDSCRNNRTESKILMIFDHLTGIYLNLWQGNLYFHHEIRIFFALCFYISFIADGLKNLFSIQLISLKLFFNIMTKFTST